MKRILHKYKPLIYCAAFLLAGCATPQAMLFDVDVMQPKDFTFEVMDQSASVVATYNKNSKDSLLAAEIARGTARAIEIYNAIEDGSVGAFTIPAEEYSGTKDTLYLEQLMLATGSHYLLLLSDIETEDLRVARSLQGGSPMFFGRMPVKAHLDIYNAISEETVYSKLFKDTLMIRIPEGPDGSYTQSYVASFLKENDSLFMHLLGRKIAESISTTWETEEWMLVDYPSDEKWHSAYKNAMDFKWEEAVKGWLPLAEDKDSVKASCAAFNIAVACQMLGNTELALSWIDYCRKKYDFSEAGQLQKYLKSKTVK